MGIRTWSLIVVLSVALLGCVSPPGREMSAGTVGQKAETSGRSAARIVEAPLHLGGWAPFDASTDVCLSPGCSVLVNVDNDCNVSISYPVLNLGGKGPIPRAITWTIIDANHDHVFVPLGSMPPALVVDKSGSADPAFGVPVIGGQFMFVKFNNSYPRYSHEYGLNVMKTNGTLCPTYDPWVIE